MDTQVSTAPDSVPTQSKSKKILLILGVFLVIALIAAGVYALKGKPTPTTKQEPKKTTNTDASAPRSTPTPNPTAEWIAYVNTTDAFTVKYPSKWKIEDIKMNADNTTLSSITFSQGLPVAQKPALLSIYITQKEKEKELLKSLGDVFKSKTFTKDDKSYILVATTYQIGASASEETKKLAIETFNNMEKTFEFIDPSKRIELSN